MQWWDQYQRKINDKDKSRFVDLMLTNSNVRNVFDRISVKMFDMDGFDLETIEVSLK